VYSLAYGDQPAIICDLVDGRARRDSRLSRPGAATNGCRTLRSPRRRPSGVTTASRPSRRAWADSTKMSIPFSTGRSRPSEATAVCNATGLTPRRTASRIRRVHRRLPDGVRPEPEGRLRPVEKGIEHLRLSPPTRACSGVRP